MRVTLWINKTLEQNAAVFFEKAKKAKHRLEGVKKTIARYEEENQRLLESEKKEEEQEARLLEEKEKLKARLAQWYHKFRWFKTSDGVLVIGGRDATTNEAIIKKHTETGDLVLHTDMAGSPFLVIKGNGKPISDTAKQQAADAACTFSRAWKLGMPRQEVFCAKPDQLSKTGKAGEFVPKGAFVILGKVAYIENKINLAVGIDDEGHVMAGPLEAVSVHCKAFVELQQGDIKPSDMAKQIKHKIEGGSLDEIIRALPAGGFKIKTVTRVQEVLGIMKTKMNAQKHLRSIDRDLYGNAP